MKRVPVGIVEVLANERGVTAKVTFYSARQLSEKGLPSKPKAILDAIRKACDDAESRLK